MTNCVPNPYDINMIYHVCECVQVTHMHLHTGSHLAYKHGLQRHVTLHNKPNKCMCFMLKVY